MQDQHIAMSAPSDPQLVLAPVRRSALFIVLTVNDGAENIERVRSWCGDVAALVRSVGHRRPESGLACVCGFGADVWPRLFGDSMPAELHPFREFGSGDRVAVSTPGDILLHIRADDTDMCFELATHLLGRLGKSVTTVDEVHGFRYFDLRSMVGFVDGTENPIGAEAASFALVGDEDSQFVDGSYVVVQKYLHDIAGWDALPVEAQERIIGRTKMSDIELDDSIKPSNSHSSLTTLQEDGQEIKVLRANMPFGRPGHREFGTYFIAYARSPAPIEQMMENMFVGRPPGNYDRLLDFSSAITGGLFFAPSASLLEILATRVPATIALQPSTLPPVAASPTDGSLNIGSLKEKISHHE